MDLQYFSSQRSLSERDTINAIVIINVFIIMIINEHAFYVNNYMWALVLGFDIVTV